MRNGMSIFSSLSAGAIALWRWAMITPRCLQCQFAPKYGDKCDGCFENQIW
jgi:hypothetical protein